MIRMMIIVCWSLGAVHLSLQHPGSYGTVLVVQVVLARAGVHGLVSKAQHLVRTALVLTTLLRHLPLLAHHLLQVVEEGAGKTVLVLVG